MDNSQTKIEDLKEIDSSFNMILNIFVKKSNFCINHNKFFSNESCRKVEAFLY